MKIKYNIQKLTIIGFSGLILGFIISFIAVNYLLVKLESARKMQQQIEKTYDNTLSFKYHTELLLNSYDFSDAKNNWFSITKIYQRSMNNFIDKSHNKKSKIISYNNAIKLKIGEIKISLNSIEFNEKNNMNKPLLVRFGELSSTKNNNYYIELRDLIDKIEHIKQYQVFIIDDITIIRKNIELKVSDDISFYQMLMILVPFLIIVFFMIFAIFVYKVINQLKIKEQQMLAQSRLAQMGEMIGNIAHQWRQPLNALGITVQKIQKFHQMDRLDEVIIKKSVDKSMMLINKMSDTIDDFMGFFRPDKIKTLFDIKDVIDETLTLLEASLKNNFIEVIINKDDNEAKIDGYRGEFSQVLINILSNAKDVLRQNNIKHPKINIDVIVNDNEIVVKIKDNGGGIPQDIIKNIFDPYFTTKEQGKGTGIGLYMSKMIIEENIGGKLEAKNINGGACFMIKFNRKNI